MRLPTLLISSLLVLPLVAPAVAHADSAPDVDKYMACGGLAVNAMCSVSTFNDFYMGTCQDLPCDSDPKMTCLTCVPEAPATGTAGETTAGELTTGTPSTGGSSGGSSGSPASTGSTSDGDKDADKGGCACNSSDAAPTGGLLLVAALLLRRRRR